MFIIQIPMYWAPDNSWKCHNNNSSNIKNIYQFLREESNGIVKWSHPIARFGVDQCSVFDQDLKRNKILLMNEYSGDLMNTETIWTTKHLNNRFFWIPDSMGVRYSNGKRHMTWPTIWIPDILDHFFQSGFHTTNQIPDRLTTRLVWYSDG